MVDEPVTKFDELGSLGALDIQAILRKSHMIDVANSLKGASEEFETLIFDNLAVRAAEVLRNKMVELGEVDQGKIETAQSEMVKTANALIASGDTERGG